MPKYKYQAKNDVGITITEVMEARDEVELRKKVRERALTMVQFSVINQNTARYRLKSQEVADFSRQLANMLHSGISVIRALEIIRDRDYTPKLKKVFERLYADVQNGIPLSDAMRLQGNSFPELFINMYATGEASGQLELTATKMANQYDKESRLNTNVKGAMTYPMILLVLTLAVIMVIFTFILPTFFELFQDFDLPMVTQVILNFSVFLQKQWLWVLIGVLIIVAAFSYALKMPGIRLKVDEFKMKIPKIGPLLKIIYTARFARTLSSLYSSGLPMIGALEISAKILGNKYIESQFGGVIANVRNGVPLSEASEAIIGFDKKLSTTILIGEESGRLDVMLESVSDSFDYEADMATQAMMKFIEPVMIIILAAIVGVVMMAVFLPIMSLYQNVSAMG